MASTDETTKVISSQLIELARLARAAKLLVLADLLEDLTGVAVLEADLQQHKPQPGSPPSALN